MAEGKDAERLNPFSHTVKKLTERFPKSESSYRKRVTEYETVIDALQNQVKGLEQELRDMHLHMEYSPREFENLRYKFRQTLEQLEQAQRQNEKLVAALNHAKGQIQTLREEVEKLTAPPSSFGVFIGSNEDGTINIYYSGRKLKVNVHPSIEVVKLKRGQELVLNDVYNVIDAKEFDVQGEVVQLKDLLDDNRALVTLRADEERVAEVAEPLNNKKLRIGDRLLFDHRSGFILEKLPKVEVEELTLEEVPDVTYADIGGLDTQIETLKDAIELPYIYSEYFKEHRLLPPKGVLLYGPPGCGKTLLAKAIANSLAKSMSTKTGHEIRGYFLNIKGPEMLNKYVGETERKIRELFQKANEQAAEGSPVVIFVDEMDSLLRTRGSGISSDVESTIVPQFLAELDGVEKLKNVIVIGASNRQDLIDPAVLRPGRLDVKIKVDRPNREAAKDIFSKYLTEDLPFPEALAERLINLAADEMYAKKNENKFLEVTYANATKETLYFRDFVSGAMIESITARAKKYAIKRRIATGERGIKAQDLIQAVQEEFHENEDLPNTTNPDDWYKLSGRRGEKIVRVTPLASRSKETEPPVQTVTPGHYL
jgi:proteasome-associated ATPase